MTACTVVHALLLEIIIDRNRITQFVNGCCPLLEKRNVCGKLQIEQ